MNGKRIAVSGTLRFAEAVIARHPDGTVRRDVSQVPEYFYIDSGEATIRAAGYER